MRMYLVSENNVSYVTIADRGDTTFFLVLLLYFFNKMFYNTAIFVEKNVIKDQTSRRIL